MSKIVYKGSVSDILNCNKIALVYSRTSLDKNKITEYVASQFEKFVFVNRKSDVTEEGQVEYFIDLRTSSISDLDTFKFNYILILDDNNKTIAFVCLGDPIEAGELCTETISVVFITSVDTLTFYIELDNSQIISDFNLHNSTLISTSATTKRDISDSELSNYKPFTSNIIHLHDNDDYIMKYSGSIIKNKCFIEPFEFDITDISGDIVKILNVDDTPYLVSIESDTLRISDNESSYVIQLSNYGSYVDISKNYLIVNNDNSIKYYLLNNQFEVIDELPKVISNMSYVIDSMTGELYFYKLGSTTNTYSYTVSNDRTDTSAGEVYCSSKMQYILEDLSNNINTIGNSIILHHVNKKLLELTEGLAIYKSTLNNKCILHSYFNVIESDSSWYFTVPEEFDKEWMLSNRCVLFKSGDSYFIYELIRNEKSEFYWIKRDIGVTDCLHNIYMLAKQKYTNPYINLSQFVFKGNLFGYFNYGNKLILASI